jgi:glutamate-1-semialdehyde 2,1-aminomutase
LIFDEVITGFRVHPGGAQAHYGVKPDVTTLAKILAGGLPGGAVVGRAEVLAAIEVRPGKPKVRHPGTYNANPLSAAAGIAALKRIASGDACRRASETGRLLKKKLNSLFSERFPDWIAYGDFSLIHIMPGYDGPHPDDDDFIPCSGRLDLLDGAKDARQLAAWRHGLLLNGVDWFGFGAFVTAAHTQADVEATVNAVGTTIECMRAEGLVRRNA